jgi:uncharacterized membrane protein
MKNLLTTTALVMSLALGGAAFAHDSGDHDMQGWDKPPHEMQDALAKLPPEKAKLIHEAMKQSHEKNKALYGQVRKLHDEKTALLTAPKFDKDAFLAKTKELRATQDKMKENMAEAFASTAAKLTPDERKVLAEAEPHHHMHHGMHGHHHEGMAPQGDSTSSNPGNTFKANSN